MKPNGVTSTSEKIPDTLNKHKERFLIQKISSLPTWSLPTFYCCCAEFFVLYQNKKNK